MLIGVLALQGAVSEHCVALDSLNVSNKKVRNTEDIREIDGLIMPGGESTTLRRLLVSANLWDFIMKSNIPIMGTCAGAILLGKTDDITFEKTSKVFMDLNSLFFLYFKKDTKTIPLISTKKLFSSGATKTKKTIN